MKSSTPVFQRNNAAGVYGPGHNGFFKSPDGTEDWIVYHAIDTSGGGWSRRSIRAQRFGWNADGSPRFGEPVGLGVPVVEPSGSLGFLDPTRVPESEPGGFARRFAGRPLTHGHAFA